MVSATALACVLLMFMFSLSYTGRFRRVLAQALQERLLLTNTTTRDRIQNDFFCCGVNSFRDYLPESGIDRESLQFPIDPDVSPYYCHTQYTHFKHMCVAPPSCCLQAQCSTLIPYYIGFVETASQWYKRTGCLDSITQSFNYQLSSTPMTIFLFVVLLCEIASVISLQFTLSSFTLLKESDNDLTSGSFGWLLPIGYPSPMELIAEMQAPCQKQNQIELNEGLADATVNQTVGDKEETKKSMMTELMKSLKSKVSQVS
ncbi:unnamed protein product [Auanema sp. JU1783]|nr:unnamed protein product [Auanema sp. JU1783]